MNDVCNFNVKTSPDQVVDFFMLMEVYGAQSELPYFESLYSPTFIIEARCKAIEKITTVY